MGGVYIHIPFCSSKCPYCDFYSFRADDLTRESYVRAVLEEIKTGKRMGEFLKTDFVADSLYIGGGTPSVLKPEQLYEIIIAAKEKYSLPDSAEITVECNPASDIEAVAPVLKSAGVNRISLGMQSAVSKERKVLGRHSDKERISSVINTFRRNNINNISLDIMLGIPFQTKDSLLETIGFIKSQNVTHVSAYILKIEDGTPFSRLQNSLQLPDDRKVCDLYDLCCNTLEKSGYNHYEISNFAMPGFESRHNTKYWLLEDYIGIGAAAHSFVNGKRFYFGRDIDGFINGNTAIFDCNGGDCEEYIMLSLRLKSGLSLKTLAEKYGESATENIIKKSPLLKEKGLLNVIGDTVSLTRKGILISNSVIAELI